MVEPSHRENLERGQLRRLQEMLAPILETNAFYRRKLNGAGIERPEDVHSLETYRSLPFTTRDEFSADQLDHPPFGSNLTYPLQRYVRIHRTSGTSGSFLRWLDTEDCWRWWARCWAAVFAGAGVEAGDRVFFAFSFGPFIGFWSGYEAARSVGALAIPGGGMDSESRVRAIVEEGATVVVCTPTYALHLAEVAAGAGISLADSRVQITIHAGEPGAGMEATRKRIEEAWGARCFDHAGATEVGAWGFECGAREGMHLNEHEFIFEVVDPGTGEAAAEGELVITNLGRAGMPAIRYRTGDRVRLHSQPCSCGRSLRRLAGGVVGRMDDALVIRGTVVYPSAIENIVRRFPGVGEFAVEAYRRGELDELRIQVEVAAGNGDGAGPAIAMEFRRVLGLRVEVEMVPGGSLPRFEFKARRVVDRRWNAALDGGPMRRSSR